MAPIAHIFQISHCHTKGFQSEEETQMQEVFQSDLGNTKSEIEDPIDYIRMLLASQTHPLTNTPYLISYCAAIGIFVYI